MSAPLVSLKPAPVADVAFSEASEGFPALRVSFNQPLDIEGIRALLFSKGFPARCDDPLFARLFRQTVAAQGFWRDQPSEVRRGANGRAYRTPGCVWIALFGVGVSAVDGDRARAAWMREAARRIGREPDPGPGPEMEAA